MYKCTDLPWGETIPSSCVDSILQSGHPTITITSFLLELDQQFERACGGKVKVDMGSGAMTVPVKRPRVIVPTGTKYTS